VTAAGDLSKYAVIIARSAFSDPFQKNSNSPILLNSGACSSGGQPKLGSVMAKEPDVDATKRLMGALVRMKPKPHEDMKVGKKKKNKVQKAKKPRK
jgi:hypothetical protein